jgi:hypothetical protein
MPSKRTAALSIVRTARNRSLAAHHTLASFGRALQRKNFVPRTHGGILRLGIYIIFRAEFEGQRLLVFAACNGDGSIARRAGKHRSTRGFRRASRLRRDGLPPIAVLRAQGSL